jgi:outer membrane murein-binding lipoprotein Lpp
MLGGVTLTVAPDQPRTLRLGANGGYFQMIQVKKGVSWLSVAGLVVVGGLSLSACASTNYDQRITEMNNHLSAVDARAAAADQKADQALSADQSAQAASARVNERVDTLTTTVDGLERAPPPRTPRG